MKEPRVTNTLLTTLLALTVVVSTWTVSAVPPVPPAPPLLDPKTIPKYLNQLTGPPPVYVPDENNDEDSAEHYTVSMMRFTQQILPLGYPPTLVWGYGGMAKDALTDEELGFVASSPGPTFEATRHVPAVVTWKNKIYVPHMFAVDPTLHWADPNEIGMPTPPYRPFPPGYPKAQRPVPLIPHLHGGEVQSTSDGHPEAWFTSTGLQGEAYNTWDTTTPDSAVFYYPNEQPPTTLWYHDHALGITRLNVMSGLAGFYLLRDPADDIDLPSGQYEMPIVIQDRIFQTDGSMYFPSEGNSPADHPYWSPEFFGDTIMVNGRVWPNMNVDQGQYRLRLLDGSNARFYNLSFYIKTDEDSIGNPTGYGDIIPFTQIGTDGGYLKSAVDLDWLVIAPGERADILVNFTDLATGTKVILRNTADAPFKGGAPGGEPADPDTVGQIMQFTVTDNEGFEPTDPLPDPLNDLLADDWPTLPEEIDETRILTLVEVMSPEGEPTEVLLNGQKWAADISELPVLGSTEDWVIVNPTEDTHPIHLHLVQFQIVYRQNLTDPEQYLSDWIDLQRDEDHLNDPDAEPPWPLWYTPEELPVTGYLDGDPVYPEAHYPNEMGWKDTIQAHPGQVTVIRVRFAPIDESGEYPFDATYGPGYVWHCHILDHEDNEMMRPYKVVESQ